jgi:UDP-N-acetyl-D-glucosamine dehydrogenase
MSMDELHNRTVAIIGQGYVGLPLAMSAIDAGWRVIGIDILLEKVCQINSGSSPVEDVSDEKLQFALESELYLASTDFSLISKASVIVVCVPTPLNQDREPSLLLLEGAISKIAQFVSNETLIISESTSYPGTLRNVIIPIVNSQKALSSTDLYFACAPERVNPGDEIWNQKNTPRLVGAVDELSLAKAMDFYKSICDEVIPVSEPEIAEAAKLFENTYRLVNIALVNELAQVCSAADLNVFEVIEAAATKPYGFTPFKPGVGVGGHCIPVDPLYLTWWARKHDFNMSMVENADLVNQTMPSFVAKKAMELVRNEIASPRILLLGVAYKPGVSDVRESPAVALVAELRSFGAEVAWHDPMVSEWHGSKSSSLDWDCDLMILSTNQDGLDFEKIMMKKTPLLDCTNSLKGHPLVISL